MRILVTGASGFVGEKACKYFYNIGYDVLAFSRSICNLPQGIKFINGESLSKTFEQNSILKDLDCVVHLAGKNNDNEYSKLELNSTYFNSNVSETTKFAKLCSKYSVKKFIFVSTIKVNGDYTYGRSIFNETDKPNPKGPYALSKYKAELNLLNLSESSNMQIVILRPPIIYGPNVRGYFGNLLSLISKGVPLPFGSILENSRSFIYIDNFLDFINTCIKNKYAADDIFLCSDQYDLSTSELINRLSLGMNKKNNIIKIPNSILKTTFYISGKYNLYEKLTSSLKIDSSKANSKLGWFPPIDLPFAIKKVAKEYYETKNSSIR